MSTVFTSAPSRRRGLQLLGALLLAAGLLQPALALDYPNRPIHLVVPFTPGGSSDILGRAIGQKLAEAFGQPVIIDNVPGAGGSLGADKVAKAAPDGYTLLMGHIGTLAVNPLIYPKLSYDPLKDFTPVAWVARVPNVLVVNPAVPAKSLKELVALLKSKPGQYAYASGGNGSAAHLAMEYFKLKTHTYILHIPYRGTSPAVRDLIAGQTQLIFTGAPAVIQFLRSGRLRPLAVSSSRRLDALPDVPTMMESGYKDFEVDQWYGVVAPAGTPAAIVDKLNAEINKSLASPELKQRLAAEGALANPTTPQAFGAHIRDEMARWKPVVEAGRIRPN